MYKIKHETLLISKFNLSSFHIQFVFLIETVWRTVLEIIKSLSLSLWKQFWHIKFLANNLADRVNVVGK